MIPLQSSPEGVSLGVLMNMILVGFVDKLGGHVASLSDVLLLDEPCKTEVVVLGESDATGLPMLELLSVEKVLSVHRIVLLSDIEVPSEDKLISVIALSFQRSLNSQLSTYLHLRVE